MAWLVCILHPNQFNIAKINLLRQGYESIFYPTFETRKRVRNVVKKVPEPLFPGYAFVEILNGQRWVPLMSTSGIARCLLRPDKTIEGFNQPAVIPDDFIANLRRRCATHNGMDLLQPGTRVRVVKGAFIAHEAVFTAMTGQDRCAILIDLLQRRIRVELSVFDVEALEQP